MFGPLLRAYAVVALCGWAVLPFLRLVLGALPDGGYAFSRCFGLVCASWLAFLAVDAFGTPLTTPIALGSIGLTAVASWAARRALSPRAPGTGGDGQERLGEFLKRRAPMIVCVEALALTGTLLFFRLQSHNPAVDPDSERFMDYAFLKAYLRSPGLPVEDPWYAGEPINYYHFGYAIAAFLVRASMAEASGLFIACVAILNALLWIGSFGVGLALTGRLRGGFVASVAVLGAGNFEWIRQWAARGGPGAFDWFSSSRVISGAISEFPWFSLLWGDLHPYVIALPIVTCALAFPLADALGRVSQGVGPEPRAALGRSAAFLMSAGAVAATHPWDLPVLLMASACVLLAAGGPRRPARVVRTLLLGILSLLLFLPFFEGFHQVGRGVAWVQRWSGPAEWGMAFGPFLLLVLLAPIVLLPRRRPGRRAGTIRSGAASIVRSRVAAVLACAGGLAALACEVVYVPDMFGPTPLLRMNTVFKLHRLAWLLSGISAPVLIEKLWGQAPGLRRAAGRAVVLLVAGGAAVYPMVGTTAWMMWREEAARKADAAGVRGVSSPGADAEALFRSLYPGDAAVAAFLASHAQTGESILEETGEPYTWSSRVATFSGAPAVLGWGNHEAGWRQGWSGILQRRSEIEAIYRDPVSASSRALMRRRSVVWAVVGDRERSRYGTAGPGGFGSIARKVLDRDGTALYRLGD